nr:MAG TPA: hypothetical protein [Caudoviricetes sp.]
MSDIGNSIIAFISNAQLRTSQNYVYLVCCYLYIVSTHTLD